MFESFLASNFDAIVEGFLRKNVLVPLVLEVILALTFHVCAHFLSLSQQYSYSLYVYFVLKFLLNVNDLCFSSWKR